jgi:hypothetical protein
MLAAFEISSDEGQGPTITITDTGWNEINLGSVDLAEGACAATLTVAERTVCFAWLKAD